jgi:glutamate synthase (NADPH/NADH)
LAKKNILEVAATLPAMAKFDDFNDRQTQIDAENEPYIPYEYQVEDNGSWAGALPVKQ